MSRPKVYKHGDCWWAADEGPFRSWRFAYAVAHMKIASDTVDSYHRGALAWAKRGAS